MGQLLMCEWMAGLGWLGLQKALLLLLDNLRLLKW